MFLIAGATSFAASLEDYFVLATIHLVAVDFALAAEVGDFPVSSLSFVPTHLPYNSGGQEAQMDSIACASLGPSFLVVARILS